MYTYLLSIVFSVIQILCGLIISLKYITKFGFPKPTTMPMYCYVRTRHIVLPSSTLARCHRILSLHDETFSHVQ